MMMMMLIEHPERLRDRQVFESPKDPCIELVAVAAFSTLD
jgi:hypothetical protein